jgi:hypothetical protein
VFALIRTKLLRPLYSFRYIKPLIGRTFSMRVCSKSQDRT